MYRHRRDTSKNCPSLKSRVSGGREPELKRFPMLLRNHPFLITVEFRVGHPAWTWVSGTDRKHPIGEIGILRDVHPFNLEPADRCFLYMDFDGGSYIGCLLIDDIAFSRHITALLQCYFDHPIAEIGSLDLSHLL